jgi:ABC-type branched-subunit amino acid transport system substrate-binding protein
MTKSSVWASVLLLVFVLCGAACGSSPATIRIGVMLPLSGPNAVGSRMPLQWAADNVNAAGGIDGRHITFVYRDIARQPVTTVAASLASDSSIAAVIGPADSGDALRVVSTFYRAHKVIVSPSATSADLFRAFSSFHPDYFWRPVESDIAQVHQMLGLAARGRARSVALVAGNGAYGNTFFDSFGFLATQAGLRVTSTIRYDQGVQSCRGPMADALHSGADAVLAVPDQPAQATCMARQWRAAGSKPRLIFSDSAQDPDLIHSLGRAADGLEGTGFAPEPGNGFDRAFTARFHRPPTVNAANDYDSVLLIAYGLQQSGGQSGPALARGIASVVAGRGPPAGWDAAGVTATLHALHAGRHPTIRGAVGPWRFDRISGMELTASTYEHWKVEANRFAVAGYLPTADTDTARAGVSALRTSTTPGRTSTAIGGDYKPGPKTGSWALLVAASDGWDNYRHQADVMGQYQRLRSFGVPAAHIIVVSADDLAHNRRNPRPGDVPYYVGGSSLARGFHVDYPLRGMTAGRLMDILSGQPTAQTPKVIHSGRGDDVFVYIAGHGNQSGVYLGLGEPVPPPDGRYSVLTPRALDQTVARMATRHDYRRMLIAVDACESGALGEHLDAPGALLLTAANPVENSLSANYDYRATTWLADQFSYQLWRAEAATPDESLASLYEHLYLSVAGSHVSAYGPHFGDAGAVSIRQFLAP